MVRRTTGRASSKGRICHLERPWRIGVASGAASAQKFAHFKDRITGKKDPSRKDGKMEYAFLTCGGAAGKRMRAFD
jgi:hypothetical protein